MEEDFLAQIMCLLWQIECYLHSSLMNSLLFYFAGSDYYLGIFKHLNGGHPSIILMTTESQPVYYSIQVPGIGYYHNGTITASNEDIVNLPKSVEVSPDDQNKGIYLTTSSKTVTVIGQNVLLSSTIYSVGTFAAFPNSPICTSGHVLKYYGVSVTERSQMYNSSVLIVGTENNTMMKLTVTQPVTIKVDNAETDLTPGRQYSFVINRLQTVCVASLEDLTGTKMVTNKSVSVFSGHQMDINYDYLIEQIPPTISWGRVYYTVPLATRRSYTIKVLAAYDSTNVDIYCNDTKYSFTINESEFINRTFSLQEHCVIHSSKKVLVAQFALGDSDSGHGDPMMTVVPAINQYTSKFIFSVLRNHKSSSYNHFVNIIVLAQFYQPDMIYLISGGVNKSLDTQKWVPVKVNNVIEAYATKVSVSESVAEIIHADTLALMTAVVYGFTQYEGYGHPGGLKLQRGLCCAL